jgi:hypothetical protein
LKFREKGKFRQTKPELLQAAGRWWQYKNNRIKNLKEL